MGFIQKYQIYGLLVLVLTLAPVGCSKEAPVRPADPNGVTASPSAEPDATPSPFTVSHEVSPHYTPGAPLTVKTTMSYTGTEPVTALALQTALPPAWTYGGIRGDLKPAIDPPVGTTGALTLIWIQIPTFPATIEYTLDVPDWTEGTHTLSTQAIYRTLGEELNSPPHDVAMTRKK